VATTPATTQDDQMLPTIHTALAAHDLLPKEHLVDAGYTTAAVLVTSQREHGVAVVGPVAVDPSWQARAGAGFEKARFVVDWAAESVTCPAGKQRRSWRPVTDPCCGRKVRPGRHAGASVLTATPPPPCQACCAGLPLHAPPPVLRQARRRNHPCLAACCAA